MTHDEASTPGGEPVNRRRVLVAGAAATTALAVTGCTTYRPDVGSGPDAGSEPATGSQPGTGSAQPGGSGPDGGGGTGVAGGGLGPTTAVPVGGGKVFTAQKVVVTQPQAGTFKAFSVTCPHQGCSVDEVADGTINCPCHGSKFNVVDGSVVEGPAKRGLTAKQVSADGGTLRVT